MAQAGAENSRIERMAATPDDSGRFAPRAGQNRKAHRHGRSLADGALNVQRPAVHVGQCLDQRQAQPRSFVITGKGVGDLDERLGDRRNPPGPGEARS